MVTRSGDSVVYMPTATEPEAPLDHQGGLLLRNRWLHWLPLLLLMRDCHGESGTPKRIDCEPVTTRLAQSSWARPGWVGSCDMLACPSAQDSVQALAKTFGGISGILLGFYNLECLELCVASKTKSLGVKGMGNVSIVMLS